MVLLLILSQLVTIQSNIETIAFYKLILDSFQSFILVFTNLATASSVT